MPPYYLSPIAVDEARRVGEVQKAAFVDDPPSEVALADIPRDAYIDWCAHAFLSPSPPANHRAEYVGARDAATGELAGWALWIIPLREGETGTPAAAEVPLPSGINERVWNEFFVGLAEHKRRLMGDRKRWSLSILVIHPDHQRRGLGTMLVSDGCKRAHAQGLPVLLTASPKGAKLYPSLGFQTLAAPVVSSAKLQQPIMVFEPPRYDFVRVVEGK